MQALPPRPRGAADHGRPRLPTTRGLLLLGVLLSTTTAAANPPGSDLRPSPPALLEQRLRVEARLAGSRHPWRQTGRSASLDARLTGWSNGLDGRFHLLAEQLRADPMSLEQLRKSEEYMEQWYGLHLYVAPAFDTASEMLVLWERVDDDDEPSRASLRWTPRLTGAGAILEINF